MGFQTNISLIGFQTNISFLNDRWHNIEKDPKKFVRAIRYGMHDGTESYVTAALDAKFNTPPHETEEELWARINNITIHRSQHADVPQVTFTYGNDSLDVYDYARGFELDSPRIARNPDFHVKNAQRMAKELRRQAKNLSDAAKTYEARHAEESND